MDCLISTDKERLDVPGEFVVAAILVIIMGWQWPHCVRRAPQYGVKKGRKSLWTESELGMHLIPYTI